MSAKLDEKRLKLAAQGLRKTAISLQAAVVSLLQTAEALTAETDDNLEHNPLEVNLQDLLKGDIHGLSKLLNDALNTDNEALHDQKTQNGKQTANGVKKSPRKPRPPRDPNAPIKPQNAYIFFQKDVASQVKAENQGKPWSEIVHLISTRWKALSKEERVIYDQRLEEAKQRYEIDLKNYMKSKDQEQEIVADADGVEGHISDDSAQNSAASITSRSDDENEEDEKDTLNISNARSSRSKAKFSKTLQPDPESSSKKRSKKRKPHEDEENESVHEEEEYEESPRKSKKKILNEDDDVQGKERKKQKKSLREDEDLDMDGGKSKKKKGKKKKQD